MKKRFLAILLCGLLLASLFSGCASGDKIIEAASKSMAEQSSAPADQTQPTTAETEPSAPATTLTPETEPIVTEPIETEPIETEPVETEPVETEPVETEPIETEPVETEPVETEPIETEPVETEPIETEPVETEPIETEPIETEPIETEPVETEPVETEPVETEPVETEPIETEPVETEPIETEPVETEPIETEPIDTEPNEEYPIELTESLTPEDCYRINRFMSLFAQYDFDSYDVNALDEEYDMLYFCFHYLNQYVGEVLNIETIDDDYFYTISEDDMNNCLERFFGTTVPAQDYSVDYYYVDSGEFAFTDSIYFLDGAYYFVAGAGENYPYITIVYAVTAIEPGLYEVYFNIFELDIEEYYDYGIDESYYAMAGEDPWYIDTFTYYGSGYGTIRDYNEYGESGYQLISYTLWDEDY